MLDSSRRTFSSLFLGSGELGHVTMGGADGVEAAILEVGREAIGELVLGDGSLDGAFALCLGRPLVAGGGVDCAIDGHLIVVVRLAEDAVRRDHVLVCVVLWRHLDVHEDLTLVEDCEGEGVRRRGHLPLVGLDNQLAADQGDREVGELEGHRRVDVQFVVRSLRANDRHDRVAFLAVYSGGVADSHRVVGVGPDHPKGSGHLRAVHRALGPREVGGLEEGGEGDVLSREQVVNRAVLATDVGAAAMRETEVRVVAGSHREGSTDRPARSGIRTIGGPFHDCSGGHLHIRRPSGAGVSGGPHREEVIVLFGDELGGGDRHCHFRSDRASLVVGIFSAAVGDAHAVGRDRAKLRTRKNRPVDSRLRIGEDHEHELGEEEDAALHVFFDDGHFFIPAFSYKKSNINYFTINFFNG